MVNKYLVGAVMAGALIGGCDDSPESGLVEMGRGYNEN